MLLIKKFISYKTVFISCGIILLLLLYKDPFSDRTLIPNFEPFPDTFNYLYPPLNLIRDGHFLVGREGRYMTPVGTSLYSLTMLPVFLVKPDPRMVYYLNILFSMISFYLLFLICRKLFSSLLITASILFLYVTNYYVYWLPTLVMQENMLLPVFLLSVWLLINSVSKLNIILIGAIAAILYFTKTASLPLVISLLIACGYKLTLIAQDYRTKIVYFGYLFLSFSFLFAIIALFEYFAKGVNIFSPILNLTAKLWMRNNPEEAVRVYNSTKVWMSLDYIPQQLPFYWQAINGQPIKFLWDHTPLLPMVVARTAMVGLIISLFAKQTSLLSLYLILSVALSMLFMSTFYATDARYIYTSLVALLLGFGLLFQKLHLVVKLKKVKIFILIGLVMFISYYAFTDVMLWKNQIMLNFKYAEKPWYYLAVVKMNDYMTQDKIIEGKKPIMVSAMPPFLIDFFSNGNYTLLPLSYCQEFPHYRVEVWGKNDYSDLHALYRKYLSDDYSVYISRYGLGNEACTNRDFQNIEKNFKLTKVMSGCYEQCNIYKLELPDNAAK